MMNRIEPIRVAQAVALSLLVKELRKQDVKPAAKTEAPGDRRHEPDYLGHKDALAIARILAGSVIEIRSGFGPVSERYDHLGKVHRQTPPNIDYLA